MHFTVFILVAMKLGWPRTGVFGGQKEEIVNLSLILVRYHLTGSFFANYGEERNPKSKTGRKPHKRLIPPNRSPSPERTSTFPAALTCARG